MTGRYLLALLLVLGMLAAGCARGKPASTTQPASATQPTVEGESRFRLRTAPGIGHHTIPGSEFTIALENCAGDTPLQRLHRETLSLPTTITLDTADLAPDLAADRPAMMAVIRQEYELGGEASRVVADSVSLETQPATRAEFTLRWDEMWETNTLDILGKGQVVASVPVTVLVSARLVIASTFQAPCPREAVTGTEVIDLPIVSGPGGTPEETIPPPGSDESIALVGDYLKALGAGDTQKAYGLLHETYQTRLPYADYVKGYGATIGIEVHAIEAFQVDEYRDLVRAGITIATRKQGQATYADWWAIFEVLVTRGKPPYQRSITRVIMQRVQQD